jgi:hypothetical protein
MLGAVLLLAGPVVLAHAKKRRRGPRYRSEKPIPGWVYGCFGYRLALDNPTEGRLEREGVFAQALAGLMATSLGLTLLLLQA